MTVSCKRKCIIHIFLCSTWALHVLLLRQIRQSIDFCSGALCMYSLSLFYSEYPSSQWDDTSLLNQQEQSCRFPWDILKLLQHVLTPRWMDVPCKTSSRGELIAWVWWTKSGSSIFLISEVNGRYENIIIHSLAVTLSSCQYSVKFCTTSSPPPLSWDHSVPITERQCEVMRG